MSSGLNRPVTLSLYLISAIGLFAPTATAQPISCKQFNTQAAAQTYMKQAGAAKLDRDGDGIACEHLPAANHPSNRPSLSRTLSPSSASDASYRVVSVSDGDTLRVSQGDHQQLMTVRLACIDAPELHQGIYGQVAAQRLKQLLPIGQVVQLQIRDTDRYGRKVAEVSREHININLQMVTEGQAVVYDRYLTSCSQTTQQQLRQAQRRAQAQRFGFWQQSSPMLPQDYRRSLSGR
jgi:endonuclease YncB( thermonuclease family)